MIKRKPGSGSKLNVGRKKGTPTREIRVRVPNGMHDELSKIVRRWVKKKLKSKGK